MQANIQLIERLAEFIETLPASWDEDATAPLIFDQSTWFTPESCGTRACIAGSLAYMLGDDTVPGSPYHLPPMPYQTWEHYVAAKLGISWEAANQLTESTPGDLDYPTPYAAGHALRVLACDPEMHPWIDFCDLDPDGYGKEAE